MRIENDIKLDYSDVLFKPKRSTLGSRKKVDLHRKYEFRNTEASFPDNIKWNILIYIDKLRKEFRNEKYLMLIILNIYFMRKKIDLENIISI